MSSPREQAANPLSPAPRPTLSAPCSQPASQAGEGSAHGAALLAGGVRLPSKESGSLAEWEQAGSEAAAAVAAALSEQKRWAGEV